MKCEIGNPTHTAWCSPCRQAGACLRLPIPPGVEDRAMPQPFRPLPPLTLRQATVVDDLTPWKTELERNGVLHTTRGTGVGEDADYMGVHPRTCWSLWKRGWIHRTMMGDRPARDKWMLTDEAWMHLDRRDAAA